MACRSLRLSALVILGLLLLSVHATYPCQGKMRWRFMPEEQALKEYAKVEVELARERAELLAAMGDKVNRFQWTKYFGNPVLSPGPPGSWEEKSADCQTIGYYNGQYMMWYVGTPKDLHCQMGLATSQDGLSWTKHPANPVLPVGPEGSWDAGILICQAVLFDEAERVFKMWYVGGRKGVFGIGLATSPDGVAWTKHPDNPVMRAGDQPWEMTNIEGQSVIKDETGYRMWYASYNYNNDKCLIGYATSPDGVAWTKHPDNPVLTTGASTEWDGYSVDEPDVLLINGTYHMWYKGWKKPYGVSWIGHATSADGLHWDKDPDNPVLITGTGPGAWDGFQVYRPRILVEPYDFNGLGRLIYKMWYSGRTTSLVAQLGYAVNFSPVSADETGLRRRIPVISQDRIELVTEPAPGGGLSLTFFTPWTGKLTLTVYDKDGGVVRTLVDEPFWPGYYQASWDRRDASGNMVPAGLYFCEIVSAGHLLTREIVLDK